MLPRKWKYITIFIIIFFCLFTFKATAEDEDKEDKEEGDDGGGDDDKEEGEEKSEKEDEGEGDGEDEEEKNGDKENEKEEDEDNDDKEGNDDEDDDKESEDEKSEGEEGDEEDDEAQSKSSKSKNVKKRKRGDDDEEESKNDEAESEVDNGSDEEGSREHKRAKKRRYICQDKDGNFVPLAYVCADVYHKKTCRALFPHDPDDPHGRPPNCDLDEIKDVVYKCAHHCKVCCMLAAYGCGDDPTYDFDCESRKHLCEKLPKLMNIACPSSCGTCHIGPCKDTVDGCISMRSTMCKHHKEFNKDLHECARSCKLCTPRCVDLSDKCAEADQSACLRPPDDKPEENVYYKAMSRVCRKSCNLCDEPFDDLEESKLIETKLNNKRGREEDEDIISEVINSNDDGDEVVSKRRRINSDNDGSEMEGDNESESGVEDK